MLLIEWMDLNGWSTEDLAKELKITTQHVRNIVSLDYLPSDTLLRKIITLTEGSVRRIDFVDPPNCPFCGCSANVVREHGYKTAPKRKRPPESPWRQMSLL